MLDATTGQNGMTQAKVFAEAIGITGVVLSKLDGSAKGGIVISVQKELGVPVKLVGLGEGPDDLAPFDPEASSTASSPELIALPRKLPAWEAFFLPPTSPISPIYGRFAGSSAGFSLIYGRCFWRKST